MGCRILCATLLVLPLALWGCRRESDPAAQVAEDEQLLESLGYVNVVPVRARDEGKQGVVRYDRDAAYDGLNLFNKRNETAAQLMTMDGRVVHRWQTKGERGKTFERLRENLPHHIPFFLAGWNHVELLPDGDLLVIGSHHVLMRLDWNSTIEWKLDISAHHDVSVSESGLIHVLTDGVRTVETDGEPIAFQDNYVVVLTPEGKTLREISLFDALTGSPTEAQLRAAISAIVPKRDERLEALRERSRTGDDEDREVLRLYERAVRGDVGGDDAGIQNLLFHDKAEDVLHANSIQVLDRGEPGLWRKGDFLVCIRNLDVIAVIDHESGRVVWTWGEGELEGPHHATHLTDGSVLVFDNGIRRGYSRIVQLDPESGKIVWQYEADPPFSFFSSGRGGCQQLPNGNVLIADTNSGHAFEVTPEGETVWEYYTPERKGKRGKKRTAIYRMARFDRSAVEPLLRGQGR